MNLGNMTLHRRAQFAFWALEPDQQARVRDALAALADTPVAQWVAHGARRYPGEEPDYLVPVDDRFRAIVRAAEGQQPEVLDLFVKERLDFYAQTQGNTSN